MHTLRESVFCGLLVFCLLCGHARGEGNADAAPILIPVTTHHTLRLGTRTLRYTATFAETVLKDAHGVPQATLSSTAYLREDVPDPARRPVLIAFNGGPGASSSPLHFHLLGPRRVADGAERASSDGYVDNEDSPLDIADIVLVDPVGTGLGRVLRPGAGAAYWNPDGDARAMVTFVRQWLDTHHRRSSPLYILGESYGGFRAATMMGMLGDLKVAGLILISPLLDRNGDDPEADNDQPYVFLLPTMAAAAWYHHRVDRAGLTVAQWYARAARFAQTDYLVGLQQGTRLPQAERARLSARMSALIGLPQATILRADLRVDPDVFEAQLLQAEHLRTGQLDSRAVGDAKTFAPRRPPFNDPSMSPLGSAPRIGTYLHDVLGVSTGRAYVSLAMEVNTAWQWPTSSASPFAVNATPLIGAAMRRQPALRLLVAGGYYDLAVPLLSARTAVDHGDIPAPRVTFYAAAAGHSVYAEAAPRRAFAARIRSFIVQAAPQPPILGE